MAKQLTDEELNLRRKARRRLVGAIVLTLAVVVLLPMVLDREPKPTAQDIDLRIPDAERVGAFVPAEAGAEAAPLSEPGKAAPESPAASAVSAPSGEAGAEAQPAVEPAKTSGTAETGPTAAAPAKAASGESFVAQVGAYVNAETAQQEMLQLKQWGFKAYTEKNGGTVRVRVGPYAERAKAEKVRELLEKHGLHPVVVSAR